MFQMDIVSLVVRYKKRLISGWADLYYKVFQEPFYFFSFNRNGNRYECRGKLRNSHVIVVGRGNTISIGKNTLLNKVDITVSGHNNRLIIRNNVRFPEGGRIRIEDSDNIIEIGQKSTLINCFLSVADTKTRLILGENCLFSAGVAIRTSDSHSIVGTSGIRINPGEDVIIGNHVWVGYGVTILKGSMIGDNCIVGTESVVSGQKIEQNTVAVGNPCRIVKRGVNWIEKRI